MSREHWEHLPSDELKELSLAIDLLYSVSKDLEAPSARVDTINKLHEKIRKAYKERLEVDLDKELEYIQELAEDPVWSSQK